MEGGNISGHYKHSGVLVLIACFLFIWMVFLGVLIYVPIHHFTSGQNSHTLFLNILALRSACQYGLFNNRLHSRLTSTAVLSAHKL